MVGSRSSEERVGGRRQEAPRAARAGRGLRQETNEPVHSLDTTQERSMNLRRSRERGGEGRKTVARTKDKTAFGQGRPADLPVNTMAVSHALWPPVVWGEAGAHASGGISSRIHTGPKYNTT